MGSRLAGLYFDGQTVAETVTNMREAIAFHLEGMREDGDPIPVPSTTAMVVEVAA